MSFLELDAIDRLAAGFEQLEIVRRILDGSIRPRFRKPSIVRANSVNGRLTDMGYVFDADVGPATEYYLWLHAQRIFVCAYCIKLIPEGDRAVDHVIPLSKGGRHQVENLAPVCKPCNLTKGNRPARRAPEIRPHLTPEAWRSDRGAWF